jgi:hypothetical protein
MLRVHDSFGGFTTFQCSVYIETPAWWACAVYPFDRPPMMVDQWIFMLVFVILGYRNMEKHLGTQDQLRFSSTDPW